MLRTILGQIKQILFSIQKNSIHPEFGGSGITEECFNWIITNIAPGSPVLEFGAGLVSTAKLSEIYKLTSIEHNEKYIGTFSSNYIHAPLSPIDGWYEVTKLHEVGSTIFDLAIIDGPPGSGNRFGILMNLNLLKNCRFILVDDTDRPSERLLLELLSKELKRDYIRFDYFSVIKNF
jgi:predicted O-methyltransferase YrrM